MCISLDSFRLRKVGKEVQLCVDSIKHSQVRTRLDRDSMMTFATFPLDDDFFSSWQTFSPPLSITQWSGIDNYEVKPPAMTPINSFRYKDKIVELEMSSFAIAKLLIYTPSLR